MPGPFFNLTSGDVEAYNQKIALIGYSQSQVSERLQMIHALFEWVGRPELGHQLLARNWDSRDVAHGKPTSEMRLLTLPPPARISGRCEFREQAVISIGVGFGFGHAGALNVLFTQVIASLIGRRSASGSRHAVRQRNRRRTLGNRPNTRPSDGDAATPGSSHPRERVSFMNRPRAGQRLAALEPA